MREKRQSKLRINIAYLLFKENKAIENIDKNRAQSSKERAEKRIDEANKALEINSNSTIDINRAPALC